LERRCGEEEVAHQPPHVEPAAGTIRVARRRHHVSRIRDEERDHCGEQQPVGVRAASADKDETHEQREEDEIGDGIRDRDDPGPDRAGRHRARREERPAAHAEDEREQRRVEVRAEVAPTADRGDQPGHRQDQEEIAAEIDSVDR